MPSTRGPAREYLKELADSDEFGAATAHSVSKDRMADRECVLRFLAFHMGLRLAGPGKKIGVLG